MAFFLDSKLCIHHYTTDPDMTVMKAKLPKPKHAFGLPGGTQINLHVLLSEAHRSVDTQETERAREQLPVLSKHEVQIGTRQVLSVTTRNGASAKVLPVLSMHELCL
jgi:hypothetical protein